MPEEYESVCILLEKKSDFLSEWEDDFLRSIQTQALWSQKQRLRLDEIWNRIMSRIQLDEGMKQGAKR